MTSSTETSAEVVKDPVCGMRIDPAKAAGQSHSQRLQIVGSPFRCRRCDLHDSELLLHCLEGDSLRLGKNKEHDKELCGHHDGKKGERHSRRMGA
jgi:hypothetical protein